MNGPAPGAISRLEGIVASGVFSSDPAKLSGYAVDGIAPNAALQPSSPEEILEIVKFAASENVAIVVSGARTKIGIGLAPRRYDIALDVTRLNRIVAYDPGDLTLSVEPGVPICHLQRSLNEHGQFLPHGAPFMTRATVGGTIASGVEGPLRQMYGTTRDFVLGMEFVTGDGVAAKSGGRVVKNVTGYDLHKLMIGSLGTLGVITKINLRTFPAPQSVRGFAAHFNHAADAVACRNSIAASALRPMTLDIMSPGAADLFAGGAARRIEPNELPAGLLSNNGWTLTTGFSGNDDVLDRCESELRAMVESAGSTHFSRIGDDKTPSALAGMFGRVREFVPIVLESSPACTIMKISVLPEHLEHAIAAAKHAADDHSLRWAAVARGVGVIYVALFADAKDEKHMKCVAGATNRIHEDCCARLAGNSTIPWCPSEWKNVLSIWGPERPDLPLMHKVKSVFDPQGILAPGRFVGGI
ncbi:MAG TPA: FAD-binding oxidoreductase [Candidatus Acidoferrales bacterium]|nr:FAD-binding oxidoreductase [Candidatus Acidoferrales bacterium]